MMAKKQTRDMESHVPAAAYDAGVGASVPPLSAHTQVSVD